ncbi:hypothetical protein JXL19_00295 [bacterium]|nr:hypothetical protein [bacterium]
MVWGKKTKKCLKLLIPVFIFLFLFFFESRLSAETFTWQDFEYWDSPQNHGWLTSCPSYPVFGLFAGYGWINTLVDFQLQSRVMSIESFATPFNQFYRFRTWNQWVRYNDGSPINDKPVISMNIAGAFGIEQFDIFEVQIQVVTRKGRHLKLVYRPTGDIESGPEVGVQTEYGTGLSAGGDPGNPKDPLSVVYNIGRQYQDGTWHWLVRDLNEDIIKIGSKWKGIDFEKEKDGFGEAKGRLPENSMIAAITLIGFNLRVDNIAFHDSLGEMIGVPPKLQCIGPQYAQIFVPFKYIIMAGARDKSSTDFYDFAATIGGYGYQGIQTSNMISRIKWESKTSNPIDPNNYVKCNINDPNCLGDRVMLEFTPQTFEDLIITIMVTAPGGLSDMETFSLSVVNYPVVNHPPYLEEIEDDVYILGENGGVFKKEFICYDQDIEDDPGITFGEESLHAGNIKYTAFIDGQTNYNYGPWQKPLIPEPFKPRIEFSPVFEGIHNIVVIAEDQRGFSAITEFRLAVVNMGTWLNHPPLLCEDIDSPQAAKAGEMFTIPIEFFDPDGDTVYYSCNIGSITRMTDEMLDKCLGSTSSSIGQTVGESDRYGRYVSGAVYTFTTHYPGRYFIEIIAYDIRGGYCIVSFLLDIQPWWAIP